MIKNLKPVHDKVLVKPVELGEKRNGSILIMRGDDDMRLGEIVSVGPGRETEFGKFIKPSVEPGMYVILPKIGVQRVLIEDEEYWLVAEKEIIAIVDYIED